MTKYTHEELDREEGVLLSMLHKAARHSTPDLYRVALDRATRRFDQIDLARSQLLQGAK